jgi:hypothetical protein
LESEILRATLEITIELKCPFGNRQLTA